MTSSPVIVNFMITSSLTPGVVGRGQPARPPSHTKSFASTKMPCSRPSHSGPLVGPPQLARSFPEASNSSTGGAAFARCASGTDCGTCNTQMLSWRSTEIDVTSPSTQLFGIVGHFGSNSNWGAVGNCCAPLSAATASARIATARNRAWFMGINCRLSSQEIKLKTMKATSVIEYIEAKPKDVQRVLREVRAVIRRAVPAAEETISYQIPAYRINGAWLLFFAGWKEHYSLYPIGSRLQEAFKKELVSYKLSKGTVRLPYSERVPKKLIEKIAKFRAKETAEHDRPRRGSRETQIQRVRRICATMP